MNNLNIEKYQNEILDFFKIHFKNEINKSINIEYEFVLNLTCNELQLNKSLDFDFLKKWFDKVYHLEYLKSIIDINAFEELIIHSSNHYTIEIKSKKQLYNIENISPDDYQLSLEVIALKNGVKWNYLSPFKNFSLTLLNHTYRIGLLHFSATAGQESKLFLRRHSSVNLKLEQFSKNISVIHFLNELILNKNNYIISGSTGSGKTTLLKSLINLIPESEHLIIMEDVSEISPTRKNLSSLLADDFNPQKNLAQFCTYAMRMSPDRMILGELRSKEVIPFILAMNTGHRGICSTIHANSAKDVVYRLSTLFGLYGNEMNLENTLVTKLICTNIQYIIHMENKEVVEIVHLLGNDNETPICETLFQLNEDSMPRTQNFFAR